MAAPVKKKTVVVVTTTARFELPDPNLAQWAAGMVTDKGSDYTESGWSLHDAGNWLGDTTVAEVES